MEAPHVAANDTEQIEQTEKGPQEVKENAEVPKAETYELDPTVEAPRPFDDPGEFSSDAENEKTPRKVGPRVGARVTAPIRKFPKFRHCARGRHLARRALEEAPRGRRGGRWPGGAAKRRGRSRRSERAPHPVWHQGPGTM